jgi:cell division cycle 14
MCSSSVLESDEDMNLKGAIQHLVPDRLAFLSAKASDIIEFKESLKNSKFLFMSSNLHHRYTPLAADFGPVNLAVVHRFCSAMAKKLLKEPDRVLVYCIEPTNEAQSNASFLLGCCLMTLFGWTAADAATPFTSSTAPFRLRSFRDASYTKQDYDLHLQDCLSGLEKSMRKVWFSLTDFDRTQYEELEHPLSGDIHQISPKLIAFKGPLGAGSRHCLDGEIAMPPEFYAPVLLGLGVSCVVRLNDRDTYDASEFERRGIRHRDLFFDDCALPPPSVVRHFLAICDAAEGRVAVHCRAGLGRTGTLIGLWLMLRGGFSADEALGWLRVVRPGSVVGRQQHYLKAVEARGLALDGLDGGNAGEGVTVCDESG